jgi:cob(I)alamin adenosyltransferase
MPIYTKTGDKGTTSLFGGVRVPKNNIRVETYGTVDELNSLLGVVVSQIENHENEAEKLQIIQRDLLDIGSRLANPAKPLEESFVAYLEERITLFEKDIDTYTEQLPPLRNFILPGGGQAGALLHLARTVTRRVERRIITLSQSENVDSVIVKYFNRLSDLLFTMSRFINHKEKKAETIWTSFEK